MRIPVNNHTLAMLVVDELEEKVSASEEFTAYSVTRAVRRRQPQLDIPHAHVRVLVHQYMSSLVSTGHYHAGMRVFGVKTAVLYSPDDVTEQAGSSSYITGVPLLPLN